MVLTVQAYALHYIIKRHVIILVPDIVLRTDTFIHYRFVPGAPLYRHIRLRADTAAQDLLAHELAIFLRQLHVILLNDVPPAPWSASESPESRRTFYERRLVALEQDVYPLLWADQKVWICDLFAPARDGRVDLC